MTLDRRTALTWMSMFAAWPGLAGLKGRPEAAQNAKPLVPKTRVRRIATEEAFTIPEMIEPVRDALRRGGPSLDLALLALIYQAPGARGAARKNLLKPSEYFQRNFAITTSGVEDPLALRFCIDKLGIDRVMWPSIIRSSHRRLPQLSWNLHH